MTERRGYQPSEEECRAGLQQARERWAALDEKGAEALSDYDRKIAYGGDDELAVRMSRFLVGNHIKYYERYLAPCETTPKQQSFFDQLDDEEPVDPSPDREW